MTAPAQHQGPPTRPNTQMILARIADDEGVADYAVPDEEVLALVAWINHLEAAASLPPEGRTGVTDAEVRTALGKYWGDAEADRDGYAPHAYASMRRALEWFATRRALPDAASGRDTERLDWLERETLASEVGVNLHHFLHPETEKPAGIGLFCMSVPDQSAKTLRAAIDAARTGGQPR